MFQKAKYLLISFLFFNCISNAQDVILFKNSDSIQAIVVEVGEEILVYKRFDNAEGPIYKKEIKSISQIKYKNGTVDFFNVENEKLSASASDDPILSIDEKDRVLNTAKKITEKLIKMCRNNNVGNYSYDVYWDAVYKNSDNLTITAPILIYWWPNDAIDDERKWVKGTIILGPNDSYQWKYKSSSINDNSTYCFSKIKP